MWVANFLGPLVAVATTNSPRVQQEYIHVRRLEQLPESIALLSMFEREKWVGPGNPEELACFRGSARRSAPRLAQHEICSSLMSVQSSDAWDDVVVAVEYQQEIRRLDVASIHMPRDILHPDNRSPVLGVADVIEIQVASLVLRDVFQIGVGCRDRAMYRRLVVRIQTKGFGKAA